MKVLSKELLTEETSTVYWDMTIPKTHNYVLSNGCVAHNTGVGFSVESKEVEKLPIIAESFYETDTTIFVADSKLGWAKALKELVGMLYIGQIPKWDVSKVRPAGAPLKTFGGRASGPEPLVALFKFCVDIFKKAAGRKLSSLECHDIVCKIAEIVVVGGVRRSALISLSDLSDDRIRHAKSGQWWISDVQRALANNSAVYTEKPDIGIFMDEWKALYDSKSGERGIFNRQSAKKTIEKMGRRDNNYEFGTNPCFTGDMRFLIADGKGTTVSFAEATLSDKEYQVYCVNNEGVLAVRKLRGIQKTRENADVYCITLDSGQKIKTTGDHKFRLRNGKWKKAKDLTFNDSLWSLYMYEDVLWDNKKSQKYRWLNNKGKNEIEHRVLARSLLNNDVSLGNLVVHHKNFNGLDNSIENLEIMTKEDHDHLHSFRMLGKNNPIHSVLLDSQRRTNYLQKLSEASKGEKNPNFGGVTNEQLIEKCRDFVNALKRVPSIDEWIQYCVENDLPPTCNNRYRRECFGNYNNLLKMVGIELGFLKKEIEDIDPRSIQSYYSWLEKGYDVRLDSQGRKIFTKTCEITGKKFETTNPYSHVHPDVPAAEVSRHYSRIPENKEKTLVALRESHKKRKEMIRERQIEVFNSLQANLKKLPKRSEWSLSCKEKNVSSEIARKSSPFRSYDELKEVASMHNHRVISVEYIGQQDVYDGCVDDFHNFFVTGSDEIVETTKSGKIVRNSFVNVSNCGEILLRDKEFCNLSEVIIRGTDTEDDISEKVRIATILGTWQSTLTNFKYLSKKWKENCEEERLLGVSLTGIMDNELTNGKMSGLPQRLEKWKNIAIETNKELAGKIGIPVSAAITCGKPSGTVSQLTDSASGIHARHNPYYIRTVRADKKDPLAKMMVDMGFPVEDDVTKPGHTYVFSFPISSPKNAIFRQELNAIEQLELWLTYKTHFTEHNPSVTISVKEHEWLDVAAWVYKNFDSMTGVSFLPFSDHVYAQAPYQDCTKEEYENLLNKMPKDVDWSKLSTYEKTDHTESTQTLACVAGFCEV